jgi:flagellar hook-associated protein 2
MEDGTITSINLATNNTITLNGKEIAIESGDSLNDIVKKINKQTNVTAFYDSFTGRMSLVSKQTGEVNGTSGTDSTISIAGALFTDTLKITQGSAQETAGANANLVINNIATERTSNSFTVNGVNITLNEASAGKSTTIEVKTDTDAIVNSIKTFIKDYNELNTLLSNKMGEQKFRDFLPLTEEQKENMSDKEVELWEGKAKSGLLRNDSILERTYNRLRTTLSSYVDNGFNINSLSDLGITTGFYQERGKLNLADEGKLRAAIENNVEAVYSVFASSSDPDGSGNGLGVVTRMYNELKNTLSDIADKAGTSTFADLPGFNSNARLSRRIGDIDKQIDTMNERLKDMEDRYYKQFTAMEQAIQRFNAQSSYLMGQFGAGG